MEDPPARHTADGADGTASARQRESLGPIVGIGASAGGLDAYTRLFRRLPLDTGCAFVLVQHLDATHPSSLKELLGRATAMPVAEATDGMPATANRVYVIPPNTELTIAGRVLRLTPRLPSALHRPIDRFLQSLADDCGSLAIGVVLSGSGSDGAAGLVAIKDAGGTTFAQDSASAEFSGMPAPEAIADELARIARHPYFSGTVEAVEGEPAADVPDGEHLNAICGILLETTGIDFSLYRRTTVRRRIKRRLAVRNVSDLGAYGRLLRAEPEERVALQRDLLIGVTSFFRDAETFDALERLVFPTIVRERRADATIRIWVPGCSTGEEAYSLLMALDEFQLEAHTAFPVQVFASDINEVALDKARLGRFAGSIAADVGPERLARYFSKADGSYLIGKDLRERCIFSRHNLLDDPPFSKLDLISCRNVLIYLGLAQQRIIPLFHYALLDSGFLVLGRSETTHSAELFTAVGPGLRLYSKKPVGRRPYASFAGRRAGAREEDRLSPRGAMRAGGPLDLSRDVDRALLAKFSPAGVLVDEHLEVLEIRGQAAPFLALTSGKLSLHLLKLVPDTGLFLEIEKLTREAAATWQPARRTGVPYVADGRTGDLDIDVTPLGNSERRAFLILFQTAAVTPSPASPPDSSDATVAKDTRDSIIERLGRELEEARARLVSMVDEHQAADEENQQVTEDALSANEELQSLSEELETAKEELQSTNEELLTVNRELEARNVALASAAQLAKATVETVGIPLMVLDGELLVRHVNSAFVRAFQVSLTSTEGRWFYDLGGGAWAEPGLQGRLDILRTGGAPFERYEVERDLPSLGRRTLEISGCRLEPLGLILLTIADVTAHRQAEVALRSSEERRRQGEKMEMVGRLAGGIAHDFNNLLTVIIGCCELIADTLGPDHGEVAHVTQIVQAAAQATTLTDQLLSFGQRKFLQPQVFDLRTLIVDFEAMLRRILDRRINVVVRSSTEPCLVSADAAEFGRVVMNLCVNARDAMPAGGTLTVETDHVTLDTDAAASQGVSPGRYVRLTITDTGVGMDRETLEHAFEPFFTTKDVSKGAGLGLSSVLGIVQQSQGAVSCESEVGRGTRFTVVLPAVTDTQAPPPVADDVLASVPRGSSRVVLLVEDDETLRRVTRTALVRAGYVVLEARNGREALSVFDSHPEHIDLMISDVLMPEMGGGVLMERALALRPDLKVLLVSGYTEELLAREGLKKGVAFLQKPYGPSQLARKVSEVLARTHEAN